MQCSDLHKVNSLRRLCMYGSTAVYFTCYCIEVDAALDWNRRKTEAPGAKITRRATSIYSFNFGAIARESLFYCQICFNSIYTSSLDLVFVTITYTFQSTDEFLAVASGDAGRRRLRDKIDLCDLRKPKSFRAILKSVEWKRYGTLKNYFLDVLIFYDILPHCAAQ